MARSTRPVEAFGQKKGLQKILKRYSTEIEFDR